MAAPAIVSLSDMMAASITPDDLDFELEPDELQTMDVFESAWKEFMKENPDLVPEGKRETRIKQMQEQTQSRSTAQEQAKDELQNQLDFFEKSREDLETDFLREIEATRNTQLETHKSLQRKLDSIGMAEHLLSQSIPFEHFLKCVDKAAKKANSEGMLVTLSNKNAGGGNDKSGAPSARAMYLMGSMSGEDLDDVELKAYQIEHALLNTRVEMLRKEVEGYEKLLETQKMVGTWLDDNNVWTMVSKPTSAASVATR